MVQQFELTALPQTLARFKGTALWHGREGESGQKGEKGGITPTTNS